MGNLRIGVETDGPEMRVDARNGVGSYEGSYAPGDQSSVDLLLGEMSAALELSGDEAAEVRRKLEVDVRPLHPLDPLHFAPSTREMIVQGARSQGVDLALWAVPALPILAGCIGNSRAIRLKPDWIEPAIVWGVSVANSGAGKSPPLDALSAPIREYDYELDERTRAAEQMYEEAMDSWRSDKSQPKPERPPRLAAIIDDATLEAVAVLLQDNPRGLLVLNDELAGWVRSFDRYRSGGGDAQRWLQIHGGRSIKVDRKGADRVYVRRAAASVVGTIQPATANRCFSAEHRESGLAARLLMAQPKMSPAKWTNDRIEESVIARWRMVCRSLLDLSHDPANRVVLDLDPDALEMFVAYHDENGAATHAAAEEGNGDIAAALSKLRGYAARLALVLALAKAAEDGVAELLRTIDTESMAAGIALARWFDSQARTLYASMGQESPEALAEFDARVLAFLVKKGKATKRDLSHRFAKRGKVDRLTASLNRLRASGVADFTLVRTAGRPGEYWEAL